MTKYIAQAAILGLFLALGLGSGKLYSYLDQRAEVDTRPLDLAALGIAEDAAPVMLSLSTCPVCRDARAWLDDNRIEFTEQVIDQSPEAAALAASLGVDAVPVFLYAGRQQTGFDPDRLRALLEPQD